MEVPLGNQLLKGRQGSFKSSNGGEIKFVLVNEPKLELLGYAGLGVNSKIFGGGKFKTFREGLFQVTDRETGLKLISKTLNLNIGGKPLLKDQSYCLDTTTDKFFSISKKELAVFK